MGSREEARAELAVDRRAGENVESVPARPRLGVALASVGQVGEQKEEGVGRQRVAGSALAHLFIQSLILFTAGPGRAGPPHRAKGGVTDGCRWAVRVPSGSGATAPRRGPGSDHIASASLTSRDTLPQGSKILHSLARVRMSLFVPRTVRNLQVLEYYLDME